MHINTQLCLGTFISLAKLYSDKKAFTQNLFTRNILSIVDPQRTCTSIYSKDNDNELIVNDQNISNIVNCRKGFAIKREIERKAKPSMHSVSKKTQKLVSPMIDENYKKDFMLALLFIIEHDTLTRTKKRETFEQYFRVYPEDFSIKKEFVFHELVASTLMYVFWGGIDNRIGKDYIKSITTSNFDYIIKNKLNYDSNWNKDTQKLTLTFKSNNINEPELKLPHFDTDSYEPDENCNEDCEDNVLLSKTFANYFNSYAYPPHNDDYVVEIDPEMEEIHKILTGELEPISIGEVLIPDYSETSDEQTVLQQPIIDDNTKENPTA